MSIAESKWVKTRVANLVRYKPSGIYFSRAKIGGKLIRQSLQTTSMEVARLRLADLLKDQRRHIQTRKNTDNRKISFAQATELFLVELESNPSLKPNAKLYRRNTIKSVFKSWPSLKQTEVRKITETDCLRWSGKASKHYASTYFNGLTDTVRMIFDISIKQGARIDNPAKSIKKARVRSKELTLPEPDQFLAIVKCIRTAKGRFSLACANLVEFLAYSGIRKMEAENVHWRDVDFKKEEITVRGDPETGTKNGEVRRIPIISDAMTLLKRIRKDRPDETGEMQVMEVRECQKSLTRACRIVDVPRITHHDLRHLFATRCIESGVDIPTVSRWLGHKDGGVLAMKTYGHLRDSHSKAQAKKVTFS